MLCRTKKKNYQPVITFSAGVEDNLQELRAGIGDRYNRKPSVFPQQQNAHRHQKTIFISKTGQARPILAIQVKFPVIAYYGKYQRIKSLAYFQRPLYQIISVLILFASAKCGKTHCLLTKLLMANLNYLVFCQHCCSIYIATSFSRLSC